MAKPSKLQIRRDLLEQLEHKGALNKYYIDLVNDYLSLWEIKNMLIQDIKKRGVAIPWQTLNKDGEIVQSGCKKNESIAELNKTNAQMLKILRELGIKPVPLEPPEEDLEM